MEFSFEPSVLGSRVVESMGARLRTTGTWWNRGGGGHGEEIVPSTLREKTGATEGKGQKNISLFLSPRNLAWA